MVKISFLVFGYRKIKVKNSAGQEAASFLLSKKITFVSPEPDVFFLPEREFKRIEKTFSEKFELEISDCLGLRGVIRRVKYKKGLVFGIILSYIMAFLLSGLVWDIRIDGNSTLSDAKIEEMLSDVGFNIGDVWFFTDKTRIESELLSRTEDITWLNINKRGTVAYVTVTERDEIRENKAEENKGYSNVVATVGCVIEEITVKRGRAEVKPGDVVKAGDILISGVLPDEAGGGFCYAEGTVIGRCSEKIEVGVSREYKKKVKSELKPLRSDIKIFNFTINIFKKYRNSYEGCDIIEDIKVFSFFGDKSLPFSINTTSAVEYTYLDALYTDEELVFVASRELSAKTASRLKSSDLVKIRTEGGFTDEGYKMWSDVVFLTDVGTTLSFIAE